MSGVGRLLGVAAYTRLTLQYFEHEIVAIVVLRRPQLRPLVEILVDFGVVAEYALRGYLLLLLLLDVCARHRLECVLEKYVLLRDLFEEACV